MSAYDLAKFEASMRILARDYAAAQDARVDEHAAACAYLRTVAGMAALVLPAIGDRVDLGPLVVARGLRVHGDLVLTSTGLLTYRAGHIEHPNLTELSVDEIIACAGEIRAAVESAGSRRKTTAAARAREATLRALVILAGGAQ